MGFSPLADMRKRIQPGGRQSPRNSRVTGFTIHHQAGVDIHGEAWNPNREVSANYWITNAGVIIPNVDESMRAWTTGAAGFPAGAASDHRNVTVEVSNSPEGVRSGTWAISDKAYTALTNLIGDVFRRHKLGTVKRGTNGGVAVHQDFVSTACPGPYIMRNLDRIIRDAEAARAGQAVVELKLFGGYKMFLIDTDAYKDDKNQPGHRWSVVGSGFFHEIWDKAEANSIARVLGDSTRVSGPRYRKYRESAQQAMSR